MKSLNGSQKKYLRGLAHRIKPTVFVGQKWLTDPVVQEINQALGRHELIKIKCIDFKEKAQKKALAQQIEDKTGGYLVGTIGHILIFYREQSDPGKRLVCLPVNPSDQTE